MFNTVYDGISGGADRSFLCGADGGADVSADRKLRGDAGSGIQTHLADGLIVRELEDMPSNFRCEEELDACL